MSVQHGVLSSSAAAVLISTRTRVAFAPGLLLAIALPHETVDLYLAELIAAHGGETWFCTECEYAENATRSFMGDGHRRIASFLIRRAYIRPGDHQDSAELTKRPSMRIYQAFKSVTLDLRVAQRPEALWRTHDASQLQFHA